MNIQYDLQSLYGVNVWDEAPFGRVKSIQALIGSYPEHAGGVLENGINPLAVQAAGTIGIMLIVLEDPLLPIELV